MKTKIIFIILFIVSLNLNSQVLQQWVTRTDYSGLRDNGNSITCDNAGNSYVTGMVTYANNQGLFVIKYNSLGNILWQDVYFGTTLGYYVGKKILVDSLGFVYVTGVHDRSIVTLKYNSSGIRQWAKFYTSVGGNSEPYDMFLDNSGHIYVTGSTNFNDMVTIKYNSFGDTLWVKTLIGPSNGYDCGKAVIVDNNGNVYVTGLLQMLLITRIVSQLNTINQVVLCGKVSITVEVPTRMPELILDLMIEAISSHRVNHLFLQQVMIL